jgi:pimeloyl-ACP methyl ester carboxylesterase
MPHLGTPPIDVSQSAGFDEFIARSLARPGESHTFEGAGLRLHYLEWPCSSSTGPKGPPVLLLHGFLAHAHWWDFVAPWLAENHRVVALDFGGMGESGHREGGRYRAEDFIAEIDAVVRHTGLEGCIAIGHSFGGRALLHACRAHPALASRAIIIDSRLMSPGDSRPGFDSTWRPKKRYPTEESILPRFVLRPEEPCPDSAMLHMARRSVGREGDAWVWKFDEQITRLFNEGREGPVDDAAELKGLTTPVDLIYGEFSRVVTPARAEYLLQATNATHEAIVLPNGFHHLPVSQPQPLLAALRALILPKRT